MSGERWFHFLIFRTGHFANRESFIVVEAKIRTDLPFSRDRNDRRDETKCQCLYEYSINPGRNVEK